MRWVEVLVSRRSVLPSNSKRKWTGTDRYPSIIEMHTFLVTLIRQFDFTLPDGGLEIKKSRAGVLLPMVIGEEHKGPQLPLKVTALADE